MGKLKEEAGNLKDVVLDIADWVLGFLFDTLFGILLVILGAFAAFAWILNITIFPAWCEARADLYELDHHYSFFTGCNVLVDGQYQDIDNVRVHIQEGP